MFMRPYAGQSSIIAVKHRAARQDTVPLQRVTCKKS